MPTPTPHMNGGHRSKLPVLQGSTSSSSPTNLKRTNDELRRHISRLKAELEVEKAKSKQVHRDKVADIKKLKDEYDKDKLLLQGSAFDKLKAEHELEIKKLRESLQREKEIEIKHILKFKDEELRTTKKMMAEDKEFSLKEQDDRLKREFNSKSRDGNNEVENKLRQELHECRKQRHQFEELYKQKAAADSEKSDLLRKLKEDHEKENQRVLRDARIQIARNLHELKAAQKAVAEKEQEITKRELEMTRLEEEKDNLLEKVRGDVKQNGEIADSGNSRTEREWELQLKNMELKKSMDELTKKLNLLEKEASGRKSDSKDGDLLAKSEQRVKELRKRNGELVNLARRLEEKAKRFQEELKEVKSRDPTSKPAVNEVTSTTAFENFKKTYTMQRAKDLAEHAKVSLAKDKEITELKRKIASLEEKLNGTSGDSAEIEKLEMVIHQIEKEKLRLEKQFADKLSKKEDKEEENRLKQKLEDAEFEIRELEELVSDQKSDIKKLKANTEALKENDKKYEELQAELAEKEEQCKDLFSSLKSKKQECQDLEKLLTDLKRKNKEIESENEKNKLMVTTLQNKLNELSKRVVQLEHLERDYKNLQGRLDDAENQCSSMHGQLEVFQEKVKDFKKIEQDLKESEKKCRKWERDYDYAVDQINKRNQEITELQKVQKNAQDTHDQEIDTLKDEITRLEDICVDLESRENENKIKLQRQEDELKSVSKRPSNHVYVQTSRPHTPVQEQQGHAMEEVIPVANVIAESEVNLEPYDDLLESGNAKRDGEALLESETEISLKNDDDILEIASSRIAALAALSSSEGDFSREDQLPSDKVFKNAEVGANDVAFPKAKETKPVAKRFDSGDTSDELSLSLDEMSEDEEKDLPLANSKIDATPKRGKQQSLKADPAARKRIQFKQRRDTDNSVFATVTPHGSMDNSVADLNVVDAVSGALPVIEDKLSVFIAKYTYDPLEHSPNDDPSLELPLEAGDYVYVFGDADEDGFFTGELVDGQRGLVPSNLVEKIADENQLISFSKGYEAYPGDESDDDLTEVTWSCAESFTDNGKDTPLNAEYLKVTPRPAVVHSDNGVLNDDTDYDSGDELEKKGLSPPRNLKVERQLKNSVVISWQPPDDVEPDEIKGYSIKADGELKETVIGSSKTKAIVSDIHRDKVCRITVHCFDKNEKEATGSAAAITVGRGASAVPSDLRILNVSPTSADLDWACGNSSMAHAVYLNGNEIHVVKPGTDRFRLTNLIPDNEYEVCVEARLPGEAHKKPKNDASLSNGLIFKTLKGGPPEPPLNVQARIIKGSADHKQTFIDISWLPVTIVDAGTSTLTVITGYKVYMNDKEVSFIEQPTEDHVKIIISDLDEILSVPQLEFIEVWMRTQSIFGESTISNVVILPVAGLFDGNLQKSREKARVLGIQKKPAKEKQEVNEGGIREAEQAQESLAPKFDFNRKDSDVDRTLAMINDLADEEERLSPYSQEAKESGEVKEVQNTASDRREIVANEGEVAGKVDIGNEGVKTKQAKVIRYNVVDSDESEDSDDEDDSDDEVQHVFDILETNQVDVRNDEERKVDENDLNAKELNKSVPENLILPSIPIRDYPASQNDTNEIPPPDYPDAVEVKPKKHFPFEELLSTSDSELSAIQEETVEDLLEYDKEGSRPASKTHRADASKSGKQTDSLKTEHGKSLDSGQLSDNGNKTFSIHSEDEKNKTYSLDDKQLRKSPDKVSEKKSSRASKDSLTFSSDDVMDLLDKDIVGAVPDLPLDDDKEVETDREDKAVNGRSDKKRKEPGIPVTDLSDLSHDDDMADTGTEEGQKRGTFGAGVVDTTARDRDMRSYTRGDDLPAKQTPAESKDQENIDARPIRRKWNEDVNNVQFAEGDASFEAIATANETPTKAVIDTAIDTAVLQTKVVDGEKEAESEPKQAVVLDVVDKVSGNNNDAELEGQGSENPMGQAVSLEQSSDIVDDVNLDGEEPLKVPLTSVHDLYTLNTIDSFDDSEAELNAEYNPYFTPASVERSAEQEDMELGDDESDAKLERSNSLKEQPAMDNGSLTEHSNKMGVTSIEQASGSKGDQAPDNAFINGNETTIEGTRSKHVAEETKPKNVRVFVALFSYDPFTMSPNIDDVDEELAFAEGDLIKIFGECDEDGFYYGELRDKCGFVPSNMVQEVSLGDFGNSFNIPPPSEDISADTEENISADPETGSRRQSQAIPNTVEPEQSHRNLQESSTNQGARRESGGTTRELQTEGKDNNKKMEDIVTSIADIDIEDVNPDYRYISERDSIYCLPPRRMIALYDYDPAISSPNVDSEVELAFNKGNIILVFGDMDEDGFYAAQSHDERGLVPSNFLEDCPEFSDSEEIEINMGAASPSIQTSSRKSSSASISGASPVDSPKTKKKKGLFAKGKKIFSKLKGK